MKSGEVMGAGLFLIAVACCSIALSWITANFETQKKEWLLGVFAGGVGLMLLAWSRYLARESKKGQGS